jgi:hypothetical protein
MKVVLEGDVFLIQYETEFEEDFLEEFFEKMKDNTYRVRRVSGLLQSEFRGLSFHKNGELEKKNASGVCDDVQKAGIFDINAYLKFHREHFIDKNPTINGGIVYYNDLKDCKFDENGQPHKEEVMFNCVPPQHRPEADPRDAMLKGYVQPDQSKSKVDTYLDC